MSWEGVVEQATAEILGVVDGRFRTRAYVGDRRTKQIEDAGGEAAWKAVSRRGQRYAQRPVVHPRAWGFGIDHLVCLC